MGPNFELAAGPFELEGVVGSGDAVVIRALDPKLRWALTCERAWSQGSEPGREGSVARTWQDTKTIVLHGWMDPTGQAFLNLADQQLSVEPAVWSVSANGDVVVLPSESDALVFDFQRRRGFSLLSEPADGQLVWIDVDAGGNQLLYTTEQLGVRRVRLLDLESQTTRELEWDGSAILAGFGPDGETIWIEPESEKYLGQPDPLCCGSDCWGFGMPVSDERVYLSPSSGKRVEAPQGPPREHAGLPGGVEPGSELAGWRFGGARVSEEGLQAGEPFVRAQVVVQPVGVDGNTVSIAALEVSSSRGWTQVSCEQHEDEMCRQFMVLAHGGDETLGVRVEGCPQSEQFVEVVQGEERVEAELVVPDTCSSERVR